MCKIKKANLKMGLGRPSGSSKKCDEVHAWQMSPKQLQFRSRRRRRGGHLFDTAGLEKEQKVLVHAASGAVGWFDVQLANRWSVRYWNGIGHVHGKIVLKVA
jgi:hypothetical protein